MNFSHPSEWIIFLFIYFTHNENKMLEYENLWTNELNHELCLWKVLDEKCEGGSTNKTPRVKAKTAAKAAIKINWATRSSVSEQNVRVGVSAILIVDIYLFGAVSVGLWVDESMSKWRHWRGRQSAENIDLQKVAPSLGICCQDLAIEIVLCKKHRNYVNTKRRWAHSIANVIYELEMLSPIWKITNYTHLLNWKPEMPLARIFLLFNTIGKYSKKLIYLKQ